VTFMTILSYMGLPEFAVSTAAETEILHHLTFEPAHSHVGLARTIPFDQLVPGAYTTAQFDDPDAQFAVDRFNEEINAEAFVYQEVPVTAANPLGYVFLTPFAQMQGDLVNVAHLPQGDMPTRFTVVPSSSPILLEVLEELHHEISLNSEELDNAWGAIIISDNQEGLRRVDLVISWDAVQIESGSAVLGEDGEPVPLPVTLESGEALLNEAGEEVRVHRVSTTHIFIHRDSAYFD